MKYSIDNERYYDANDILDILNSGEFNDITTIYEAEDEKYKHSDFIRLSSLTEDMEDLAYDAADEYSYEYLRDLTIEKAKELENIIINWFNHNVDNPDFFKIKNIKEIPIQDFLKMYKS